MTIHSKILRHIPPLKFCSQLFYHLLMNALGVDEHKCFLMFLPFKIIDCMTLFSGSTELQSAGIQPIHASQFTITV